MIKNSRFSVLRSEKEIMALWPVEQDLPVVSILCPAFNHEKYISDALHGFLSQETNFRFEVLVNDDASTDGTRNVIERFVKEYPQIIRFFYSDINQFSIGNDAGRGVLLQNAKGKYIALCDGDDFWVDPCKLIKQKEFLDKNSDVVVCYTAVQAFNDQGILDNKDYNGQLKDLTSYALGSSLYGINTSTVMFRNLVPVPFPTELRLSMYGDLTFWILLSKHGRGSFLCDIEPSWYRVHSGGVHSMVALHIRHINTLKHRAAVLLWSLSNESRLMQIGRVTALFFQAIKCYGAGLLANIGSRAVVIVINKFK